MKIFNVEHKKSNAKLCYDTIKIILAIMILTPVAKQKYNTDFILTGLLICSLLWWIVLVDRKEDKMSILPFICVGVFFSVIGVLFLIDEKINEKQAKLKE